MSKSKSIYLFILGCLFGLSISILGAYYFVNYTNFPNLDQKVNLNSETILDSIKSSIQSMNVGNSSQDYKKFETAWDIIKNQHIDGQKFEFNKAMDSALKGFVDSLDDPYTIYFTNTENKSFQQDLKGEKDFEGIGAVVAKKSEGIMIEEVLKGFPAHKAGLKPLDIIVKIAGEQTQNMSLSDAVAKIRGPKGSEVELEIYREGEKELLKYKVMRDTIVVPSVSTKIYELTGSKQIGYINISIIGEDTEKAFKDAIAELKSKNVKGIILDLRGNGGGYLPIATEVMSHFVPKDKVVVTSKYRIYPDEIYKSKGYGDFEGYPLVVLIDGMSASAAEIIASGLRDELGIKLIGTKTFGKGSIQTIYDLKDGSSIKYTIGRWYTPKGTNVDKVGLEPDVKVDFDTKAYTDTEFDNQLDKAKQEILPLIK